MAGRPAALIDWKIVDRLLQAGCTGTQIAARVGIHANTLYEACKEAHKCNFSEYSHQKKEHGETLLHEQQFALAMQGNLGMLIWLGKQRLGQKDKSEHTGKDGAPLLPPTDLSKLSTDELRLLMSLRQKLTQGEGPTP